MLTIGLFDMLQLVPIVLYLTIYLAGWTPQGWTNNWLERPFGASFNVAWDTLIMNEFLLALNRLLAIAKSVRLASGTFLTSRAERTLFNVKIKFISFIIF